MSDKEQKKISVKEILKKLFLHNGLLKLLSLLISVVLWAGLISQDKTLTREKNFQDVSVSIVGEDAMKQNGLIVVSNLNEQLQGVSLQVDVPQLQYETARGSNYNTRVDLSKISAPGVQEVRITSSGSSTWGSVKNVYPDTVTVDVEEYVTRFRIPVTLNMDGQMADGWWMSNPSLDPPIVAVSGPKSVVTTISRARVNLNADEIPEQEGDVLIAEPFELLDRNGNVVENDLIQVTMESVLLDSVIVEASVYPTRVLEVSDLNLISGTPAEGYEVTGVSMVPSVVTCAGKAAQLEMLDTLFADQQVDLTGLRSNTEFKLRLRKPSELVYTSTDTVTLVVEISPVIISKTIDNVKIVTEHVPSGINTTLHKRQGSVTITGEHELVQKLKATDINLVADLEGVEPGTTEVPLTCRLLVDTDSEWSAVSEPATVQVKVK